MTLQPTSELQSEREAQFLGQMAAFVRRDFSEIERTWRRDVVMVLPGTSWLAGNHRGFDAVSRCVVGLRQVLASEKRNLSFLHEGDQMIVRHDVGVHGPTHEVNMSLVVRMRYDADGKVVSIGVEPDDLGLFDHVVNSVLRRTESA